MTAIPICHLEGLMRVFDLMNMWRRPLLTCLAALGFGLMLWSAADWYELMRGDRLEASFCNYGSYWNCDRATLSPLGAPLSIPLGVFGAVWFWVAGLLALSSRTKRTLLKFWLVLGAASVLGCGIYLTFILKAGCAICFAGYLLVLGVLALGWPRVKHEGAAWLTPSVFWVFLLGGSLFLVIFASVGNSRLSGKFSEEEFQRWYASLETVGGAEASAYTKGSSNPKIEVLEFSDFGCPNCDRANATLVPYLTAQSDIRLSYYPHPLDSTCNSRVPQIVHAHACAWSKAALCSAQSGGDFWEFHDRIFKMARDEGELPSVDEDSLQHFSRGRSADFDACLKDPAMDKKLSELLSMGEKLGVSGTPTFIVNGRKIPGFIPLPLMRRLIEEVRKS